MPRLSSSKQHTAHTRRHAETKRVHGRRDVLHRIVDCQTGRDAPAGGVDVELDGLGGVFGFEEEELGGEQGGGVVVDLARRISVGGGGDK